MEIIEIIFRVVLTFVLSVLFGFERQKTHKPIGFGSFIFVAIGACTLAIAATTMFPENPTSMLSAIVTGIGFLGAGALIKTNDKIIGSTTAAGIWVCAIFGLIMGIGEYLIGLMLYLLIWMVIICDRYLKNRGIGSYRRKVILATNKIVSSKEIESVLFAGIGSSQLVTTDVDKKANRCIFSYFIEGSKEEMNKGLKSILEKDWCESIKVE